MNKHLRRIVTASMASAIAVTNFAALGVSAEEAIVDSAQTLTEEGVLTVNGFTVTPAKDAAEYSIETVDTFDNEYRFKVVVSAGYAATENAKVKVLKGPTSYTIPLADIVNEDGEYETSISIDKDTRLEVEGLEAVESEITISDDSENTGFEIEPISNDNTASPEDDYTFRVISDGTHANLSVSSTNGNIVQGINNTYTLQGVTEPAEITLSSEEADSETYSVAFPTGEGYSIKYNQAATGIINGESFEFVVEAKEGYQLNELNVYANGVKLEVQTSKNGTYTYIIKDISANVEVTIDNVKLANESEISIDKDEFLDKGILFTEVDSNRLDTYRFTLTETEAGALDNYTVIMNDGSGVEGIQQDSEGVYYLNKNTGKTININLLEKTTSSDTEGDPTEDEESAVTWPTSSKYEIKYEQQDENTYYFTVTANEGYDVNNITVKANNEVLTPDKNGVYRVSTLDGDVSITVSGVTTAVTKKETYTVTWTAGTGTSFDSSEKSVEEGTELKFSVNTTKGYSAAGLVVTANGSKLTPNSNGEYSVVINKDTEIKTSNLSKEVFGITTSTVDGATINAPQSVVYGESYEFTVTVDDNHKADTVNIMVNGESVKATKVDGQTLTYTIANVTDAQEIKVVDVAKKQEYTVSFSTMDGVVAAYGTSTVREGGDFTFTLTVKNGYNADNMVVKVNGQEIAGNNGTYTITNIQENKIVSISGVRETTYCIQTQVLSGIVLSTTSPYDVKPGGSFTFSLSFNSTIDPTTISVTANGQKLTGSNWTYTVSNILEDVNIQVTANNIALTDSNSTTKKGTGSSGASSTTPGATTTSKNEEKEFSDVKTGDSKWLYPLLASLMGTSFIAGAWALLTSRKKKLNK